MEYLKKALITISHLVRRPFLRCPGFMLWAVVIVSLSSFVTLQQRNGVSTLQTYLNTLGGFLPELLFDVYVLAFLLSLLPRRVYPWVRAFLYFILYAVAITDGYCFVHYGSTINPSILMLVGETNASEAGEFLSTLLSPELICSPLGWFFLLITIQVSVAIGIWWIRKYGRKNRRIEGILNRVHELKCRLSSHPLLCHIFSAATVILLVALFLISLPNKQLTHRLMTRSNIGEIEHMLTDKDQANLYSPIHRLVFSVYANRLTAQQVEKLKQSIEKINVDSCSFTSPNIVLIIGESFNRHHSQQYGYWQPNTPNQIALEEEGNLIRFSNVVSPWNLTSFCFKLMFTTYCVGDEGEWCDYPLFPVLFRKAGYHTAFLTNQFLPQAKEAVYDFSGGFFLNDETLSKAQFETRNSELFTFDESLIDHYIKSRNQETDHNLTIFHLRGQHMVYNQRFPDDFSRFHADDYKQEKPHLNDKERYICASYDNAILYNDHIVSSIIDCFKDRDAIVIYVPDHGEEVFEDGLHFYCRMHSTDITARLAKQEFDIPFWIYCSPEYIEKHADIYQQIRAAKDKRYMTDALPHLLLYLAGISCDTYNDRHNLISPQYDEQRPRILKNTTDYDSLFN